jgi:hypothetical protein
MQEEGTEELHAGLRAKERFENVAHGEGGACGSVGCGMEKIKKVIQVGIPFWSPSKEGYLCIKNMNKIIQYV